CSLSTDSATASCTHCSCSCSCCHHRCACANTTTTCKASQGAATSSSAATSATTTTTTPTTATKSEPAPSTTTPKPTAAVTAATAPQPAIVPSDDALARLRGWNVAQVVDFVRAKVALPPDDLARLAALLQEKGTDGKALADTVEPDAFGFGVEDKLLWYG